MKIRENNISYFSYSPLILLIWGILSILFIPVIPIASGFGWDGVFYGKVALNFEELVGNMDTYHAGRIFPGILVHYTMVLFKIPFSLESALTIYQFYYLGILMIASIVWVKIASLLNLNEHNKWISFIALFVSYPVLNLYFYYPSLTDGTIFLIAILLIYYYLRVNYLLLFVISIVSFFSWPTGIIMCFIIFVYGQRQNVFWGEGYVKLKRFLLILILLSPLLAAALVLSNVDFITSFFAQMQFKANIFQKLSSINKRIHYDFVILISSLLLVVYYVTVYWVILRDFKFVSFFKIHFEKNMIIKILIAISFIAILILAKRQLYNPTLPTVTAISGYAYPVFKLSSRFPLQFIVCHIAFWGPSILLLIFFFRRFINYLKETNLAIMLGLIFTLVFSINAESRAITNFYPFIIFILVQIIDFSKIKYANIFPGLFLLISLAYAKIWLQITLPSSTYPNVIDANLDQFPMQWYFMNFGLWINYQMYLLHALSSIIFGILVYLLVKNYNKQNTILQ